MYNFSYDADTALMHVTKSGFWTLAEFRGFETAFMAHHREIVRTQPHYCVLGDCTDYSVQSAEISAAYTTFFDDFSRINRNRFAILVSSALAKMQAKRAMPHESIEIFTDRQQAMTWLFADAGRQSARAKG